MIDAAAAPPVILHVDDDEDFAYLTQLAFKKAGLAASLHHVGSGVECLQFLRREPPYVAAPEPAIVLLDVEMPGMDGREVLAEIVNDAALRHLPVVVLTTRDEDEEILRMYRLRCNSYIRKPSDLATFADVVRKFADYWLSVAVLPNRVTRGRA
jgi:CheY-like chemotaxis protein